MSTVSVTRQALGSNIVMNPLDIKTVRVANTFDSTPEMEAAVKEEIAGDVKTSGEVTQESVPETPADRRAKRREEYRDAALIRERALQMQKQAEDRIKQTEQFASLMQQAKEDPTVMAKALGMTPEELQRKMFNKMYSIKDEAPKKEETFEDQTKRRLAEYEAERNQERARREEEARQYAAINAQQIKNKYIQDNILPVIGTDHEFIHRNDKDSCAALVYDLMNQAYQDHVSKGGQAETFSLKAQDVVNQLEEELQKRAEAQILEAKNIGKLKKYFGAQEEEKGELGIGRKNFSSTPVRRPAATLSHSSGTGAPPAVLSGMPAAPAKRIPFNNRDARREAAKKILGQ